MAKEGGLENFVLYFSTREFDGLVSSQGSFYNQLVDSMRFTILIDLQRHFLECVFAFVTVAEI